MKKITLELEVGDALEIATFITAAAMYGNFDTVNLLIRKSIIETHAKCIQDSIMNQVHIDDLNLAIEGNKKRFA